MFTDKRHIAQTAYCGLVRQMRTYPRGLPTKSFQLSKLAIIFDL